MTEVYPMVISSHFEERTAIQRAEILCRTRSDSGGLLGVDGIHVALMVVSFRLLGVRTLGIGA